MRDGRYWLATSGGLVLFNPQGVARRWTARETEAEARDERAMFRVFRAADQTPGRWNLAVGQLTEDANGNLWCIAGSGVYVLDRGAQTLRRISDEPWGGQTEYWAIAADDSGAIWVAVAGAIYRLLPDGRAQKIIEGFGFVSLYKDRHGDMWAGGARGLLQFTCAGLALPRLLHDYTQRDGLMSRYWHYGIIETADGKMWVGSVNGLSEAVGRNADGTVRFRTISNLVVNSLGEDGGGNVWVGTESSGNLSGIEIGGNTRASLVRTQVERNKGNGVYVFNNAKVSAREVVAARNKTAGFRAEGSGAELNLVHCVSTANDTGALPAGSAPSTRIRLTSTAVTNNTTAGLRSTDLTGVTKFSSQNTNLIEGNGTNIVAAVEFLTWK